MIAYHTFDLWTAVEIEDIIYDIEDYIVFRYVMQTNDGRVASRKTRSKVHYSDEGDYFMCRGRKIMLNECIRVGA